MEIDEHLYTCRLFCYKTLKNNVENNMCNYFIIATKWFMGRMTLN